MANLWDELDDDTAESRAAKGLKQIAQATLDSGPMPKAGSEEFASGKAEPSADLMDIIPVEKAALTGAAGAAKVASLIKGAALAKAGASKPALGALALGAIKSVAKDEAKELPMDLASRIARAEKMGFDTSKTFYHGTAADFDRFKLSSSPKTGALFGTGVYTTSNPDEAAQYATRLGNLRGFSAAFDELPEVRQKAKELYPQFAKIDDPDELLRSIQSTRGPEALDKYRELISYLVAEEERGSNIIPLHLKTNNPISTDAEASKKLKSALVKEVGMPKEAIGAIKKAKYNYELFDIMKGRIPEYRRAQILEDIGHDAVIDGPVTMVLDPSQVRSKFAAFDPEKASSSNLSAGLGGAALLGGAAASSQDAQAAEPEVALQSAMQHESFNDELQKVLQDRPDLVPVAKKIGLIGD